MSSVEHEAIDQIDFVPYPITFERGTSLVMFASGKRKLL
jgi:hypothetical protein